jgi:Tfp pilus assembly protein PilF
MYQAALSADLSGQYSDAAHFGLGMCYLRSGQETRALEEFQTVIVRYPGSPKYARAAVEGVRLLMKRRQFAAARRILYQLIGRSGGFAQEDRVCVEWAYYAIARSYEGEAEYRKVTLPAVYSTISSLPTKRRDQP